MSRIFKSIARELATEAGVEVCRGYMLERLRLVTSKDLYKAIKDGTHTMGVSEEKDRNFGRKWSRVIERFSYKGTRLQRNLLTAENVLEWLKVDRPELASLIINMNPQGMEWLKEDVRQIGTFLFSETKPKATLTLIKRQPPTPEKPLETQPQEESQPSVQTTEQIPPSETSQTQAEPQQETLLTEPEGEKS